MLNRTEILEALSRWYDAWNAHDFEAVMALFHDQVVFENWTGGKAEGKVALRAAWGGWFADHGEFRFDEEDTFVDEAAQKALYRWTLRWPSREPGREGQPEVRCGVDVLHFEGGKIVRKLTYSKTTLEIGGVRVRLRS
ncbi:MAG: nuclear transport factor 2 family protein [Deltaproteobacteria bacterium]|nr:nuclear transport factor 2 family protein [Deltaproteobacteria bacterium]